MLMLPVHRIVTIPEVATLSDIERSAVVDKARYREHSNGPGE